MVEAPRTHSNLPCMPASLFITLVRGGSVSKRDRARERRRKQSDIAPEESKAIAKNLTDTRTTLRSLSETLQTTALLSSPLYLVPST